MFAHDSCSVSRLVLLVLMCDPVYSESYVWCLQCLDCSADNAETLIPRTPITPTMLQYRWSDLE